MGLTKCRSQVKKISIWRVCTKTQNDKQNLLVVGFYSSLLAVSLHSGLFAVSF